MNIGEGISGAVFSDSNRSFVLWHSSSPEQPNGPNDVAIKRMSELSAKVLVGWGNEGRNAGTRPREVLALLGQPVFCLRMTSAGEPTHPLYLPLSSQLIPYVRQG